MIWLKIDRNGETEFMLPTQHSWGKALMMMMMMILKELWQVRVPQCWVGDEEGMSQLHSFLVILEASASMSMKQLNKKK